MEIYYIDKNGAVMHMASDSTDEVVIPVIIRRYPKMDTELLQFDFVDDNPINNYNHKKNSKFTFADYKMRVGLFTGKEEDFVVDELKDEDTEIFRARFAFWFTKRCDYSWYLAHANTYHRGHTCFWHDTRIVSANGITAHLYGNCAINLFDVRDCLFFVHGTVEIR